MRILVAEDDAVSRRVLEAVLERMGHECDVAEDGDEAWARLELDVPDVLITDWMMPGLAGPDLCRKVRAVHGDTCYVMLLTALSGDAHVRAAMDAGADDFLTKPLDRNQLAMRLAVAERLHALRARLAELERR
jgi:two-component system cell cycle response regulator